MIVVDSPIRTTAVLAFSLLCMGCIMPETPRTVNGMLGDGAREESGLAEYYAYHNDQGMLADRSIADIHFVPHSVHLSGTGEARLARYAELLDGDGGIIHYETSICDEDLIEARLAVARSYLAKASQTGNSVHVVLGLPGGRGMPATESAGGQAVARQAEQRGTAYRLAESGAFSSGGR